MRSGLLFLLLLVAFGLGTAAAEAPPAASPERRQEYRLGFMAPLSGEVANWGLDMQHAVRLALEDLGGENPAEDALIKFVFEDVKCSGKEAATAASKLINVDKVQAIIDAGCSSEVLGAAPVVERNKVILLSSCAESQDVTHAGDFVFRLSPSAAAGGRDAAEWMFEDSVRAAALLSENTDYALSFGKVLKGRLEDLGIKILVDETFNSDLNDFRTLLSRIRQKLPDALFVNPQSGSRAGLIVRQIKELRWGIPIYGNYSFSSLDAQTAAGGLSELEGVKFVDYPVVTTDDGVRFIKRFEKSFRKPQSDFGITATYDAVRLLADAIRRVGYNGSAIRDYFYKMPPYQGAAFSYAFDSWGDVLGVSYVRKTVARGEIVVFAAAN
jgi:branched-chain amino acid transport system substrate-binding protein